MKPTNCPAPEDEPALARRSTDQRATISAEASRVMLGCGRVLVGLISVQTLILLAALPWGYTVHGRLARVETSVLGMVPSAQLATDEEQDALRDRVVRLEVLAEINNPRSHQHQQESPP